MEGKKRPVRYFEVRYFVFRYTYIETFDSIDFRNFVLGYIVMISKHYVKSATETLNPLLPF